MCLCVLQGERKRRNDVCQLNGKENFAEAAVEEAEGRDGVEEENDEGENKKEERGKRQAIHVVEGIGDGRDGGEGCHRDIERVVAEFESGCSSLVFEERFVLRTIDFGQEIHGDLQ